MVTIRPISTPLLLGSLVGIISLAASVPTELALLYPLKAGSLLSQKCNGCRGYDPEEIEGDPGFEMPPEENGRSDR